MSFATLEEVAVYDDEGRIEGLQFSNRNRRLQEWRDKQDKKEFAVLIARLRSRNWARDAKTDPVRLERIRANHRRHRLSGRKQERENQRRREQYEADPVVNVCEECNRCESVPYEKGGAKRSRFCSKRCRNRWHEQHRDPGQKLSIRKGGTLTRIRLFLSSVESATAADISAAIEGKQQSVRSRLCRWAKAGELKSDGCRPARYSIQ